MGTFGGHALPGSFFIAFAVWWTIQVFRRYYRSLRKGAEPFVASATYTCNCGCPCLGNNRGPKSFHWEGAIKILFTGVGFTLEIITAFKDGKFAYLGNGQHATMFFFFGLSGVTDILVHYRIPLPKGIDYVMITLAFVVEGLLFKFHLHGRNDLDVLIHTLLLYAIYANVLFCLVELRYRNSTLATLGRAYFVLLQGTWFWQLAFILYNPIPGADKWDPENHEQMMVATMMFAWHMGGCLILMLVIGGAIGCVFHLRGDFQTVSYDRLSSVKLLMRKDTDSANFDMEEDSDEFEQSLPPNGTT